MMGRERAKGNPDPSRWLSGGGDTAAGDRDGRVVLRGSADAGGWRNVAGGDARIGDRRDCNSAGRDHSASIRRSGGGIRRWGKPVIAELLRPTPPCVVAGGTGQ